MSSLTNTLTTPALSVDAGLASVRELLARISPQEGARLFASEGNPTGMFSRVELVGPERAAALLQEMPADLQRAVRNTRVENYARQRAAGKWRLHHQGIALDVQGRVRDGQHRLRMIVATGLPTLLTVFYNVPEEGILHVDEQLTRSTRDSIRMAQQGSYSCSMVAALRAFVALPENLISRVTLSREDMLAGLERWYEPLQWAESRLSSVTMVTRSVRGLVARASLHVDRDRLAQFCDILKTGMPVSEDREQDAAAIVYLRFLASNRHTNEALDHERYLKGQTAILNFVARTPISRLYGTDKDVFPLPVKLK